MTTERWIIVALIIGMASYVAVGGPLSPPGGPVQPTFKTLDDVNPSTPISADFLAGDASAVWVIDEPGAYHLVADVVGQNGKHGIRIDTSDVTLDLGGFNVRGTGAGSDAGIFVGIDREAGVLKRFGIVVKGHGRVFNWGQHGIDMGDAERSRVEDVISTNNMLNGISIGNAATVLRCTCDSNLLGGVSAINDALIEDCVATASGKGEGIRTELRGNVARCVASLNVGSGIRVFDNSVVTDCAASNNANGVQVTENCVVSGCAMNANQESGLVGDRGLTVQGCYARNNAVHGFDVNGSTHFLGCHAFGNTRDGFRGDSALTIGNCTARANSENGFQIGEDSHIYDCHADANGFPGIAAFEGCRIVGNVIQDQTQGNTNAGIGIVGGGCRVEGNHIVNADEGIRITGTNCVVVKNSVSDCPDPYGQIAGGNKVGSIVATPIGANAWANFRD